MNICMLCLYNFHSCYFDYGHLGCETTQYFIKAATFQGRVLLLPSWQKKLTKWGKKVCDIRRGELRMGL